ncbi:MAG: LPS export ABC transporter periplasmic protein LptC [Bacteroidetes bacterium]|nr:LPS export ABC transporter periplasmic protein LptC [Bacteroidota bacterium]
MPKLNHIFIILLAGFIAGSCTNDLKDVMALPRNELSPSQVGDSVTMLYTDSTKLKIMVKANRMLVFDKNVKEPLTILPRGVFVTFFDNEEKVSATLKANYGIRFDLSKRMEAKYAVEVVNKNGEKLETEKLTWDERTKRIYTDAFVKITTGKEIIMGKGMESNQDFTKYEIKKVTGQIQLKND